MDVSHWLGGGKELARVGLQRAKAAAGGAPPTFEDGSRVSEHRDPDTAFAAALERIDRREGLAFQIARQWKIAACVLGVSTAVCAGGWWWDAYQRHDRFIAVYVDGAERVVGYDEPKTFTPTTQTFAIEAADIVDRWFRVSTDPRINSGNYDILKHKLSGNAIATFSEWWKAEKEAFPQERDVSDIKVTATTSANTVRVTWVETDYAGGNRARRRAGDGLFTFSYTPQRFIFGAASVGGTISCSNVSFHYGE